jgi:hypothetical protein
VTLTFSTGLPEDGVQLRDVEREDDDTCSLRT